MAYLIESVFTMLALAAKTQDRLKKYFLQVFGLIHQLDSNTPEYSKRFMEHQIKKPPHSESLRVAFRLKPDSFIEVNCTAKN